MGHRNEECRTMDHLVPRIRYVDDGFEDIPSLDAFTEMGRKALAELPEPFASLSRDVVINAADFPEPDVLEHFGFHSPYELLGLFTGMGLAQDGGHIYTGRQPNRVWLYRMPIIAYWEEHDDTLQAIVTHVLIHEIGHHFGLSDADMDRIEQEAG